MATQCARCKETAGDGASQCPQCEYNPGKSMRKLGAILLLVGIVLSITVIGSPLGIPVAVFGLYRILKGDRVTVEDSYGV